MIVVVEYDPEWPIIFDRLKARIWPSIAPWAMALEHVGSTSVPGLAVKPVIDMDIIVTTLRNLPHITRALSTLGYEPRGNLGIEGREAFRAPEGFPIHHLYVCEDGSLPLRNHLILRDHLRSHPNARAAYAALKRRLASSHSDCIERYVEGKTEFIIDVLRNHGITDLQEIRDANRVTGSNESGIKAE